jgi:CspA family cold shock protein
MAQGVVKVYDPTTGFGVVVLDADQSEVLLRPGSLSGSIFRSLRQGQRINFDVTEGDEAPVATKVRIGSDGY